MINKNRPGSIAADFPFTLSYGGTKMMLSIAAEYLLILFYNPECADCVTACRAIQSSPVLLRLQKENRLKVLAICPDEDLTAWKAYREKIPTGWINGHNERVASGQEPIYDLRAIPTLYLLDKNKRVVLKETTLELIERTLLEKTTPQEPISPLFARLLSLTQI